MTNEIITAVIEKAEARGLGHFGIRAESKVLEVGAYLQNSAQFGDTWDGEELGGTCALRISYDGFEVEDIDADLASVQAYATDDCKIILIGGTDSYEGTDANEKVIKNAEILYVF